MSVRRKIGWNRRRENSKRARDFDHVLRVGFDNVSDSCKLKYTVGFLIVVDDEFDTMLL